MIISFLIIIQENMTKLELQKHVEQQVNNILCYQLDASRYIDNAVNKTNLCLKKTSNKYGNINDDSDIGFSVYNSLHYTIFIYWLSRVAYEMDGNGVNAEKFYYLNKILHSVDLFYAIELPEIWSAEHPVGAVMGRAKYSNRFFFYQGCTIGGNKGCYPELGECVVMYSNSKVLGNAKIGHNVILSANTYVKDEVIPDNSIVFGQSPNLIIKDKTENEIKEIVAHIWKF